MADYSNDKKLNIGEKLSIQKKKKIIYTVASIVVLILIVSLILYTTGAYKRVLNFFGLDTDEKYSVSSTSINISPNGDYVMAATSDTIVVSDETGMTGYDKNGVWKWHEDIIYVDPVMTAYEEFVLVYDSSSKKVATYGSSGYLWSKTFAHKIRSAIAHNGTDFVTVITDGEEFNSEVTITDCSQTSKDIFYGKYVDEYIVSAAISSDRSQFALSGVYTENNKTVGVIMFVRMSDGETYSTEIFDAIYPYIDYTNNCNLIAANSDSILKIVRKTTIDTKHDVIKSIWSRNSGSEMLLSIDVLSGSGFCASFGNADEYSELSSAKFYDVNGNSKKTYEYNSKVVNIKAGKDQIAVATENGVHLYKNDFNLKGEYTSMSDVFQVDIINKNILLVQMDARMMTVNYTVK